MSLTFTQSISANQSFHGDPDFIITIDGIDITPLVASWQLTDGEEGAGEITVTLINPNLELGGVFGYGQKLAIRFGYQGQLSPKATVDIVKISEKYPTGSVATITLTGRDDLYKMCGGAKRESLKKGKGGDKKISGKEALENAIKDAGVTPQVKAPKDTEYRAPFMSNENPLQVARRLLYGIGPQ